MPSIYEIAHHRADLIGWHCTYRRRDGDCILHYPGQRTIIDPKSEDECVYWIKGKDAPGGKWGCWVRFTKMRVVDPTGYRIVDERKLNPVRETAQWQNYKNDTSEVQNFGYKNTFGTLISRQKSFEAGFEQSVEGTFGTGDGSPVTASVTVGTKATQTFTHSFGMEKTQTEEFSRDIAVAPGTRVEVRAWRDVCKIEQDIVAFGDLDMDIEVANWYHGGWNKTFKWHYKATFTWDQFLQIVTGAPLPYNFSSEFQQNPLPQQYIDQLEAPLTGGEIRQTLVFDNVQQEDVDVKEFPLAA